MLVLMFWNWFFNINIILFLIEYIYFRKQNNSEALRMELFNRRHIILHISIILGAMMQLAIVPHFNINNEWTSALVILLFSQAEIKWMGGAFLRHLGYLNFENECIDLRQLENPIA